MLKKKFYKISRIWIAIIRISFFQQLGHGRLSRGQGHRKSHHLRGTKDSKDNEIDLHRTLSVDGFSHAHRSLQDTSDCLLWEVHSEGALIPLPGIDSTLAEQMVLLKPVCEQVLRQTELLSGHRMCLDQRGSDSSSTWSILANGGSISFHTRPPLRSRARLQLRPPVGTWPSHQRC